MSNKLKNAVAAKSMAKMYLDLELADVCFVFPNDNQAEKLPAHRAILATTSPVFKAMFYGPLKEANVVKITDSNASAFKEFLQFFYLPEITLTVGNIEEIVRLADKYDMLDCFETCAEFLKANFITKNMVWGYQLAITLNNARLIEFCEKHIQVAIDQIMKSEMFLQCSRDVITHILKLDTLECDEVDLFNACIEWAKASCLKNGLNENDLENLKNELGPCFYLIRFSTMDAEEMADLLESKIIDDMFTKDELADYMRSKGAKRPKLELSNHQPRSKPVFAWNKTNKLVGTRVGQPRQGIHVQWHQSTWFSSNEFILLGEIGFIALDYDAQPTFNVTIVEHDKDDFVKNAPTKILYLKKNLTLPSRLALDKAIAIRSHKMYEIHLERTNNYKLNHCGEWLGTEEVKLDDKITIKFQQNPTDQNSTRRGLVSKLYFNRIE